MWVPLRGHTDNHLDVTIWLHQIDKALFSYTRVGHLSNSDVLAIHRSKEGRRLADQGDNKACHLFGSIDYIYQSHILSNSDKYLGFSVIAVRYNIE